MTEWWQASDAELLVALGESNRELNAAYLGVLEVVGEVSGRGLGGKEGFVADVELVRCAQNVTRRRSSVVSLQRGMCWLGAYRLR